MAIFPAIALEPGDVIEVILRPAPGALPELPGFEDDDEETKTFCPTDVNGDGMIDVVDLTLVILAWGTDDPDADINNDGDVNVIDLTLLILDWGPCEPM